jgi:single-strand DNA-binding protein
MLPIITGEFGVVAEPDLRFSEKGAAWLKLRVIAKDRVRDASGTWGDGDPLFIDIVTNNGAEHLFESIVKGDTIMVIGKLKQREYEKDGEKRTVMEVEVEEIGPSLKYATAKVNKASRGGGGGGFGGGAPGGGGGSRPAAAASNEDPWGSAPASGSFGGSDDEPPF